ncbi:DUF2889 domain-containing protein [Paraburkholderia aromaticivorans]|uniref:DUF2889 domain-containing protein n=1 Tax=Paraburkholderia aromaticivorans TaxID=2026199 RepID=UPI0014562398|nr:DUF2889 domain-containing protein [Paraburkholderia aromaticivorans]
MEDLFDKTTSLSSTKNVTREALHDRQISMRGFRRSDGLYEVEGSVTDRKPRAFTAPGGGRTVAAHEPIHEMGVRLVFDDSMVVRAVNTFMSATPYGTCSGGADALESLIGLRIGAGWNSEVRRRLGGGRSCTHLLELLSPLATAALQSMGELRMNAPDPVDANGRPMKIDSCYAYAADGEVVALRWPQFQRNHGSST